MRQVAGPGCGAGLRRVSQGRRPDGPVGGRAPRAVHKIRRVAHTFEELLAKQRAADEAHTRVLELRDAYGPPTQKGGWNEPQRETYETAWRAWRDLDRDLGQTVTEYAKAEGTTRGEVEAELRKVLPDPEERWGTTEG